MTMLRDIQAAFIHDIYTGEFTSLAYLDTKVASSARINIYQNNTVLSLTNTLADIFPVMKKIVGDEFFKTISRHFIRSYPLHSGNRNNFGGDLMIFLEQFKPAASLPYLRDVAALEWAYFQAALADDASPLNFKALTAVISANPTFVLTVHPGLYIVPQTFNALEIWQEHKKEEIRSIDLRLEPHQLIIWRDGSDDFVYIRLVSEALESLIAHTRKGLSFAEAMTVANSSVKHIQKFQKEFAEVLNFGIFVQTGKETP